MFSWLRRWWHNQLCYHCKCGFVFEKATAKRSGGAGYSYGLHVHCPRCDKIVAAYIWEWKNED